MGLAFAVPADIPRIVGMIERLCAAVGGPLSVDRDATELTVARLMARADAAVWVTADGFLAASIERSVINPAPVAVEHGWFAGDGSGLRLLRAYERWARDMGAQVICLSTGPGGPDLSRLGYRAAETAWVK